MKTDISVASAINISEERPIMGKLVNEVRDILEEEFNKKEKELN